MRTLTKKPQREQQMKEFQELKTRPIEPNDEKSIKILEHPSRNTKRSIRRSDTSMVFYFLFFSFLIFGRQINHIVIFVFCCCCRCCALSRYNIINQIFRPNHIPTANDECAKNIQTHTHTKKHAEQKKQI